MRNSKLGIFNKKGSAFMCVVIALLVATLMIASGAYMAQSNIKQANNQEKSIQACYVARSGAEIAYEALRQTGQLGAMNGGGAPPASVTIENIGDGKAKITVAKSGDAPNMKIIITSVGTLNQLSLSRKVILTVYADWGLHNDVVWSR